MEKKGFRKLNRILNYLLVLRFLNIVYLMKFIFKFEAQACLCNYRLYFYENCYFSDQEFFTYECFSGNTAPRSAWASIAKKEFEKQYPNIQFNIMHRSTLLCLDGNADFYDSYNRISNMKDLSEQDKKLYELLSVNNLNWVIRIIVYFIVIVVFLALLFVNYQYNAIRK